MVDFNQGLEPISALTPIIETGYFGGASKANCGVTLSLTAPRACLLISARKDQKLTLTKLLQTHYGVSLPSPLHSENNKSISISWAGNDQWFLTSTKLDPATFYRQGRERLLTATSVCDQSQGRTCITISGPQARALLEKGMPVDLHQSVFKVGSCATTDVGKIAVHLWQTESDEYELSCSRSFSESLWQWLCEMSLEFGYRIE